MSSTRKSLKEKFAEGVEWVIDVEDLDENFNRTASQKRKNISENVFDANLKYNISKVSTKAKHKKREIVTRSKRKSSVSPEKNIATVETEQDTLEKKQKAAESVQESAVYDIEDGGWEPNNWKIVWENILKMRKLHVAPVDSLGAGECPEKGIPPEVFRYQTLISVLLSSQTKDEQTHAATQRLIEHGLTVDNILNTSEAKIRELIRGVMYFRNKAKFIKETTQTLKDEYNGDVPRTLKELCKLKGVGPKMANIVMSVGWNETVGIAVDTHVHRISNRLGWMKKETKTAEETRKALESWLPKDLWESFTLNIVGFGQTVCKAIRPSCDSCLNKTLCPSAGLKKRPKKKKLKD